MSRLSDEDRVILQERDRYLEARGAVVAPSRVRPEIAASWQRSIDQLVDTRTHPPDFQRLGDTRLSTAALPVIDHYLGSLTDTRTGLLFADAEGRLIGRWTHDRALRSSLATSYVEAGFSMAEGVVGTNGVGTVFEVGAAVEIKGAEHFSDQYLPFTCVGAPIRHPLTRRIVGVIDITCRNEDASPLAMPWIRDLARHIENQLLDRATTRERALLSAYLRVNRTSRIAVACLNGQMLICNPAASALLSDADQGHLWAHVEQRGFRASGAFSPLEMPGGRTVMYRAKPVSQDGVVLGVVVEAFEPPTLEASSSSRAIAPARARLEGLVGESDRWVNVCEQASVWRRDGGGVVVVGEPGVGKLAVIRAALPAEVSEVTRVTEGTEVTDGAGLTVLECSLVVVDGARDWLAALRTRLQDPRGTLVLRHVQLLDDTVAQAVCALLDQVSTPPRIAATVVTGDDRAPYAPLLDRFEVHRLEVPPLRHRLDDLPFLLAEMSRQAGGGPRWLAETVAALGDQPWPDNVRGLAAVVRRVLRTRPVGVVAAADLPDELTVRPQVQRSLTQLERLERQEIIETLGALGGNKVLAAKKLNLARSTLYRKMAALGIHDSSPLPGSRR